MTHSLGRNRHTPMVTLLLVVPALLAFGGCSSDTSTSTGSSGASVPASVTAGPTASVAPDRGAALDAKAFAAALKRPGTVVLDVRTPAEFAAGHLPGAVNLDIESADFSAGVGRLAKDVPYAVYCRSGNRSGRAVATMASAGFKDVYHLAGGIGAWQAAGGEIVTS